MSSEQLRLQLYLTHRPALIDYVTPIAGSRANAEDVVQEAYLRFVPEAAERPLAQPLAYLYRIVRNLALDRTRATRAELARLAATPTDAALDARTPEQAVLSRDGLRRVETALEAMPEPMRIAFTMVRFEEARLEDVAQRLGVSIATAHRLVREALMRCAREIDGGD